MATRYWLGNALARKQVQTITVAGTWGDTETATLTMNGKDLILTLVGTESTANVAIALKEMWMSSKRLDGTGTTDATSNAGGQEFGEFSEVSATVSGSVVTLTANKAGVPFTVSVAETAGSGTLTLGTVQTATGPHHWDNADNWDDGSGGSGVPSGTDTVVFQKTNVCCLYGMPAIGASEEYVLNVYMNFTGCIGLPAVNRSDPNKPYAEYRSTQLYLSEDSGVTSASRTHKFGIGQGTGSPLINLTHVCTNTSTVSAIVYNTGNPSPLIPGGRALNLEVINLSGSGTLTVLKGSVECGFRFGGNTAFATYNVGWTDNQAADVDLFVRGSEIDCTLNQSGGRVEFFDSVQESVARTFNISGGTCICRDTNHSGNFTVSIQDARLIYNSTKTIASVTIGSGGILDLEKDSRGVTISVCDLFESASLLDEYKRGTYSAGIDLNGCGLEDVTLRLGNNRRLTIGAAA